MGKRLEIRVESYAGARADERPRRAFIDGREHLIARVLNASLEEDAVTKRRNYRFKVIDDAGREMELLHSDDGRWFLIMRDG